MIGARALPYRVAVVELVAAAGAVDDRHVPENRLHLLDREPRTGHVVVVRQAGVKGDAHGVTVALGSGVRGLELGLAPRYELA